MLRQAGVSGHAYPVGVHQPRLFVHPRPRSLLPRLQLSFGFCLLDWHWGGGFERKRRKYPVEFLRIPLRLSLSLRLSFSLSSGTPPFSLVSFSGFGRRERLRQTLSLSLSLGVSLAAGLGEIWSESLLLALQPLLCSAAIEKKKKKKLKRCLIWLKVQRVKAA